MDWKIAASICWVSAVWLVLYCIFLALAWPPVPEGMWNTPIIAALLAIGAGLLDK